MIKLKNIINELGINKPVSNSDMLNHIIEDDGDGSSLIQTFHNHENLEDYIKSWGKEDENILYAKWYYKMLNDKNIYVFEVEDSDTGDEVFPKPYKYCDWIGLGDSDAIIIMHNIN